MPLVTLSDLLVPARRGRYAVPAINVANYETTRAAIDAAEAEGAPLIVQFYRRLLADGHARWLAPSIRSAAERASVPVALHLDHGESAEDAERAIDAGFTSVMIDASKLPLEENIGRTAEVAAMAKRAQVSVEAELGHVPAQGCDAREAGLTDPGQAAGFVRRTGIDALAVAIGTAHGFYKTTPVLDIERLGAIAGLVEIPLVLHGGSGTPADALRQCIGLGIAKINIATEYQALFLDEVRAELDRLGGHFRPVDLAFKPVVARMTDYVRSRLVEFGARARGTAA